VRIKAAKNWIRGKFPSTGVRIVVSYIVRVLSSLRFDVGVFKLLGILVSREYGVNETFLRAFEKIDGYNAFVTDSSLCWWR
jgi:hypothetical protein